MAEQFKELHLGLTARAAVVEANRCLNCFDAPCMGSCPTHIDVPRFIKKIATGNVLGSAHTILEANVLGASCARVCPVKVLCEGSCVMHGRGEKPIEIGRLQRFAMDGFWASGLGIPMRARLERRERVVCVGAGPASLACAAELRQNGIQVVVLDRRAIPGGLNTFGVAEYKLRMADSVREAEMIRSMGVEFRIGEVVSAADFEGLEREFEAIFLGVGLGAMRELQIEGGDSSGITDALEFIAGYKSGERMEVADRVVVIGAGNTAIDAAIAARRLGAAFVTVVYRRGRESVSAFDFEVDHAMREGVVFVWNAAPLFFRRDGEDRRNLVCARDGGEWEIGCDLLIPAIGQTALAEALAGDREVRFEEGRVVVERATGQTATNSKYFAGGDCVNGGREVVDAVADGRRAALGIVRWLGVVAEAQGSIHKGVRVPSIEAKAVGVIGG